MSRNKGRVVIVTGAGSGIGRAAAARFHSEGAMVVAVDLTDASLEWTQGLDAVVSLAGDVTDPQLNDQMVDLAVNSFGQLDGAVLNAGILAQGDIREGPWPIMTASWTSTFGSGSWFEVFCGSYG